MPEDRESEKPQTVAEIDEVNTVVVGERWSSPAKVTSVLQGAPFGTESIRARVGDEQHDLTMAEKDCVLTSSDQDVEDSSDFVTEKLQCLSVRSVEKFIESVNVEEILCGSIGVGEDGGGKVQSVCPNVRFGWDVDADNIRFSPGEDVNQIFREKLVSANITSSPKKAA